MTTEFITFKLLRMPCCGHQLCWVNPRWPSYCPECGTHIYPEVKEKSELTLLLDDKARLQYHP